MGIKEKEKKETKETKEKKEIVEDILEGFDFGKAVIKPIEDAGKSMGKDFEKKMNKMKKNVLALGTKINDSAKNEAKKANKASKNVINNLKKPFKDIEKTIKQFSDYFVVFFKTINPRFQNLFSGIEVIFKDGLIGEVKTIGDSMTSGFNGIGYLFAATGELIKNYLICGVKWLRNLYFCIFFYALQILIYIIYLPIWVVMWALKTFTGIDMFFIEERTMKGLRMLDGYTWYWLGFHIIYWPKNVRDRCFTCIRLKKKVLKNTAKAVDYNFNERIRKASGLKMKWAERVSKAHMKQFISWPKVKKPNRVRSSIPRYKLPPTKYRF